jgi:hypothetical protein
MITLETSRFSFVSVCFKKGGNSENVLQHFSVLKMNKCISKPKME